jgi:hypothetical protein
MLTRLAHAFIALFFLFASLVMWLFAAARIVLQIDGFDPGFVFMATVGHHPRLPLAAAAGTHRAQRDPY